VQPYTSRFECELGHIALHIALLLLTPVLEVSLRQSTGYEQTFYRALVIITKVIKAKFF
jgi:hypothetical protein